MGIRLNIRNLPPLCSFALGAVLVLIVGGVAWWFTAKHEQQQWQSIYGRTLAVLTAKSAIDATLNHDLVSLQVVLQDAALSRYVSLATIHDVENNLLVQAGDDPSLHLLKHLPTFSAAISFQKNIAGYVTVYLENPPSTQHFQWVMLGGIFLLLLVAGLSLFDNFREVFEYVEPDADDDSDTEESAASHDSLPMDTAALDNHKLIALKAAAAVNAAAAIKAHTTQADNDDIPPDADEDSAQGNAADENLAVDPIVNIDTRVADDAVVEDIEIDSDLKAVVMSDTTTEVIESLHTTLPAQAELMVYVQDFSKFQQALSADLTAQMMQQLMRVSERAMAVYNATWSKPPELTLNQGFLFFLLSSDQSEEEALEAAVLLAHLIKQAFKPRKIKMQLDVIVAMEIVFASLKQRPNSSFAVHLPHLAQQMALFERMHFSLLDGHWFELVNVDESYQALLSDQVLQISI